MVVYSGSSLLAVLNFQSVSGLYQNFTRMSHSEFEFLINLIQKNLEKGHSVQEIHFCSRKVGTETLRFLASGDSYVSLQCLFKFSKQAISCIVQSITVFTRVICAPAYFAHPNF
jgi:hypothetical protein